MSTRLDHAVGLLERSLVGTRSVLGRVGPGDPGRPTPCAAWDLAALLDHMDDSLGAYLEASHGALRLLPTHPPAAPAQACTLLGVWSAAAEQDLDDVELAGPGGHRVGLPADLLVSTAALEVAVHGWDVARSLGEPSDGDGAPGALPPDLAAALLPVARCTVASGRAEGHFADVGAARPGAGPVETLLTLVGRA